MINRSESQLIAREQHNQVVKHQLVKGAARAGERRPVRPDAPVKQPSSG